MVLDSSVAVDSDAAGKMSVEELETSGQSNLTSGRIAAAHGRFSRILQVAPMCTPYIESQKWLPWQRPSAPMDPHPTHDSYGPSEPTTQTASLSVQPSLHRRP